MDTSMFAGMITLIVMVLANAGVLFYWGGKISTVIEHLEKLVGDHEVRIRTLETNKR